jgi:hypothetical protein
MKLPANAIIAPEKVTDYLLVRQSRNDKSAFLETSGYNPVNPDVLISSLVGLREQNEAVPIDENQFGRYYEVVGVLRGPLGVGLRVRTIWMTEHLSGVTKFITLIPVEALNP